MDTDPINRHPEHHKFRDEPKGLDVPWAQGTRVPQVGSNSTSLSFATP